MSKILNINNERVEITFLNDVCTIEGSYGVKTVSKDIIPSKLIDNIDNVSQRVAIIRKIVEENDYTDNHNVIDILKEKDLQTLKEMEYYLKTSAERFPSFKKIVKQAEDSVVVKRLYPEIKEKIGDSWVLITKDGHKYENIGFRIYDTCSDQLFWNEKREVFKRGHSGVVDYGADRFINNKEFMESIIEVLKNKENYKLFSESKLPIER